MTVIMKHAKGRHRLFRQLVVLGLSVCVLVNLLLARLHHNHVTLLGNDMNGGSEMLRFMHKPMMVWNDHQTTLTFANVSNNDGNEIHDGDVRISQQTVVNIPYNNNNTTTDVNNKDEHYYIPPWMQEYFVWHHDQRSQLNTTNVHQQKYLIMICRTNDKCGGTADRLKPFLLLLLMAHQTQRLLFIHWEQPCPLEEFLVPPPPIFLYDDQNVIHGLDWRLPKLVQPLLLLERKHSRPDATTMIRLVRAMNFTKLTILTVRYQSYDAGSIYYNQYRPNGLTFEQVYPHAWRRLFTPVAPIMNQMQHVMNEMQLIPGTYVAAHVRAFRGVSTRNPATIRNLTVMALNCVSQLVMVVDHDNNEEEEEEEEPQPIFFASDSSLAVQIALEYGKEKNAMIVSRPRDAATTSENSNQNPLHLEKSSAKHSAAATTTIRRRARRRKDAVEEVSSSSSLQQQEPPTPKNPAAAYYDTFVDLYLLAGSRCMTYNIGGFGHWASLLSFNSSCSYRYTQLSNCEWRKKLQPKWQS